MARPAELPPTVIPNTAPWEQLRAVLEEHALLLALIAGYIAVGVAAGITHVLPRSPGDFSQSLFLQLSLTAGGLLVLASFVRGRLAVRDPEGRRIRGWGGWKAAWAVQRRGPLSTWRLGRFLLVLVALPLFARAFIGWKAAIPVLNPFSWDLRFSSLDAALHGGMQPWEILQPALGRPSITRLLDASYLVWHLVTIGVVVWQAWRPDRTRRMQFLLAFVLIWILLGTVVATALSSAGPCYFTKVTGRPDPYAPLFQYLHGVDARWPLGNLRAQEWLWDNYTSGAETISISAMPSLHVALPVLYVLATRDNRLLAGAFTIYALLIFLASVHLGWHYAIDGYLSVVVVPIVWHLAGLLARTTRRAVS